MTLARLMWLSLKGSKKGRHAMFNYWGANPDANMRPFAA